MTITLRCLILISLRTLFGQLLEGSSGQRASNLQTLGHNGRSDQLVADHLLQELVIRRLVEEDGIVELIAVLSL